MGKRGAAQAEWNLQVMEGVVARCYARVLVALAERGAAYGAYGAWPTVAPEPPAPWRPIVLPSRIMISTERSALTPTPLQDEPGLHAGQARPPTRVRIWRRRLFVSER